MNLFFKILDGFLGMNILKCYNKFKKTQWLGCSELRELQLDKMKHLGEIK